MTLVVEILTVVFDSHVLFTSSDCLKFSSISMLLTIRGRKLGTIMVTALVICDW